MARGAKSTQEADAHADDSGDEPPHAAAAAKPKGHSGHEDSHEDHSAHDHGPPPPPGNAQEWAAWALTGVISGLINGMLIFVFCCVFGSLIFSQNEALLPYIAYGVSWQAGTATIAAILASMFSGCGAVISGPDINPAIFLASMAEIVSSELALVGEGANPIPCDSLQATDRMRELHACADRAALIPTLQVLFVGVTVLFGVIFVAIGVSGSTKITQFIPAPVLGGFMACIGYKIMKGSVEVATGGNFYECREMLSDTSPKLEIFNSSVFNKTAFAAMYTHGQAIDAVAAATVGGAADGGSSSAAAASASAQEAQLQQQDVVPANSYECAAIVDPAAAAGLEDPTFSCGLSKMLLTWDHGWRRLLPALPIGVPMYVLKRYHIGLPRNWMPAFIVLPNVIAYGFLAAQGQLDGLTPVESLRSCGAITPDCPDGNYNWFFPAIGSHDFTLPYRNYDPAAVRWDAVLSLNVLPVLIVMVIIVNIDVLLKLAGTEKQLAVSLDMNREMVVAGVSNFFNALVFGPPGYGQTKFSVLNFAIVRDAKNRLPGFVCGLFNAAMFLSGFPLINYLPRFFLAGLLIFAGAGFIVENLFDARSTLSPAEFGAVWLIVIANAFAGLLPAIVFGVILSSLIFAKQYSRAAVIKHQLTRKDFQSKMCRDPHTDWKLQQLGHAIVAIRLQGFIFFGTASKLQDRIAELIADREQWVAEDRLAAADEAAPSGSPARGKTTNPPEVELAHSVRYLLLDFESVSDVDSTGVFAFTKLRRMTKECGIETLFTTMSPRIEKKLLHKYKIVPLEAYIPTLHEAVERCEEELLAWAREIRERWFRVPQLRALRQRLALQSALDLSAVRDLFPRGSISISQLQKYCSREVLAPRTVLIAEGSCERRLFLQVSGRVKVFCSMGTNNPMAEHVATVAGGSFVNEEGFFLAAPSDVTVVVDAAEPVGVVCWSLGVQSFTLMMREDAQIAMALQAAVIRSMGASRQRLKREVRAVSVSEEAEMAAASSEQDIKLANTLRHGFALASNTLTHPHPHRHRHPHPHRHGQPQPHHAAHASSDGGSRATNPLAATAVGGGSSATSGGGIIGHQQQQQQQQQEVSIAQQDAAEEARLRALWRRCDVDSSGTLDKAEVRTVMSAMGMSHADDEEEFAATMRQLDRDGSGEVDYREFLVWWQQQDPDAQAQLNALADLNFDDL